MKLPTGTANLLNHFSFLLFLLINLSKQSTVFSFTSNHPTRSLKFFHKKQHNVILEKPPVHPIPGISRNDPLFLSQANAFPVSQVGKESQSPKFQRVISDKKIVFGGLAGFLGLCWLRIQSSSSLASISFPKLHRYRQLGIATILSAFSWMKLNSLRLRRKDSFSNSNGSKSNEESITARWYYYASHANARNRAFLSVLMKVGCIYLMERLRNKSHLESGTCLTNGLLTLGPTYVKLGQILSSNSKVDVDWRTSLERLQDRVPATTGQEALELARQSYDNDYESWNKNTSPSFDTVFDNFDTTPLASASIGQVHLATLRSNNETVALKIQRPRLQEIYDQDSQTLMKMSKMVDKFRSFGKKKDTSASWVDIFTNAQAILYKELNYTLEGEYGMRMAHDFGLCDTNNDGNQNVLRALDGKSLLSPATEWLRIPRVYPEYSNSKVLVMENVPSVKVTDAISNLTETQKIHLSSSLARAYLRQFCVTKFFSTDPHPGNVGVEFMANEQVRLVLYDFGQACFLSQNQSEGILDVMEGIIDSNAEKCVQAFSKMGVLQQNADYGKILQKVQSNFDTGKVTIRKKNPNNSENVTSGLRSSSGEIGNNNDTSRHQPPSSETENSLDSKTSVKDSEIMSYFTLPAEYAFVARAISQMDGVGKSLDPEFDFISASAPFLVEIKGTEMYLKDYFFNKFIYPVTQKQIKIYKEIFGYTTPRPTIKNKKS